jgi:hypothetical protein
LSAVKFRIRHVDIINENSNTFSWGRSKGSSWLLKLLFNRLLNSLGLGLGREVDCNTDKGFDRAIFLHSSEDLHSVHDSYGLADTRRTGDEYTFLDWQNLLNAVTSLICVSSWHHHIKVRHVFDVLKLLHLSVPWHPVLWFSQVIVVVEHSESTWELCRLKVILDVSIKVVLAPFVEWGAHTPSVTESHNWINILTTRFGISLIESLRWIKENLKEIDSIMAFSYAWGMGASLDERSKDYFDTYIKDNFKSA